MGRGGKEGAPASRLYSRFDSACVVGGISREEGRAEGEEGGTKECVQLRRDRPTPVLPGQKEKREGGGGKKKGRKGGTSTTSWRSTLRDISTGAPLRISERGGKEEGGGGEETERSQSVACPLVQVNGRGGGTREMGKKEKKKREKKGKISA